MNDLASPGPQPSPGQPNDAREALLEQLGVAAALADINSRADAAVRERAAAAARLAQAGGLSLIQEHIRQQPVTPDEKRENVFQLAFRAIALVAAALLFVAAAWLYDRVEDLEISPPAAASAAAAAAGDDTQTATGEATEGATGTSSSGEEQTETGAADDGADTAETTATDSEGSGTAETGAGETNPGAATGPAAETEGDAEGETAPATGGATTDGEDDAPSTEKRTHLSTVPLAFLMAGSLLAALALLAPRTRSITASKDAIALTLDPRVDPFGQLAQALADAARKSSDDEPDDPAPEGDDPGGADDDKNGADEDNKKEKKGERRGREAARGGGRRRAAGLDPLFLEAAVEVARAEQVRRKKRWRPWSR